MKKFILLFLGALSMSWGALAQEYKVITVVEARNEDWSRLVEEKTPVDYKALTMDRVGGQGRLARQGIKINSFAETKLLNPYSVERLGGRVSVNFQNIASNDAVISSKLNDMAKEGWELVFVVSGVESVAVSGFFTRFIFKR